MPDTKNKTTSTHDGVYLVKMALSFDRLILYLKATMPSPSALLRPPFRTKSVAKKKPWTVRRGRVVNTTQEPETFLDAYPREALSKPNSCSPISTSREHTHYPELTIRKFFPDDIQVGIAFELEPATIVTRVIEDMTTAHGAYRFKHEVDAGNFSRCPRHFAGIDEAISSRLRNNSHKYLEVMARVTFKNADEKKPWILIGNKNNASIVFAYFESLLFKLYLHATTGTEYTPALCFYDQEKEILKDPCELKKIKKAIKQYNDYSPFTQFFALLCSLSFSSNEFEITEEHATAFIQLFTDPTVITTLENFIVPLWCFVHPDKREKVFQAAAKAKKTAVFIRRYQYFQFSDDTVLTALVADAMLQDKSQHNQVFAGIYFTHVNANPDFIFGEGSTESSLEVKKKISTFFKLIKISKTKDVLIGLQTLIHIFQKKETISIEYFNFLSSKLASLFRQLTKRQDYNTSIDDALMLLSKLVSCFFKKFGHCSENLASRLTKKTNESSSTTEELAWQLFILTHLDQTDLDIDNNSVFLTRLLDDLATLFEKDKQLASKLSLYVFSSIERRGDELIRTNKEIIWHGLSQIVEKIRCPVRGEDSPVFKEFVIAMNRFLKRFNFEHALPKALDTSQPETDTADVFGKFNMQMVARYAYMVPDGQHDNSLACFNYDSFGALGTTIGCLCLPDTIAAFDQSAFSQFVTQYNSNTCQKIQTKLDTDAIYRAMNPDKRHQLLMLLKEYDRLDIIRDLLAPLNPAEDFQDLLHCPTVFSALNDTAFERWLGEPRAKQLALLHFCQYSLAIADESVASERSALVNRANITIPQFLKILFESSHTQKVCFLERFFYTLKQKLLGNDTFKKDVFWILFKFLYFFKTPSPRSSLNEKKSAVFSELVTLITQELINIAHVFHNLNLYKKHWCNFESILKVFSSLLASSNHHENAKRWAETLNIILHFKRDSRLPALIQFIRTHLGPDSENSLQTMSPQFGTPDRSCTNRTHRCFSFLGHPAVTNTAWTIAISLTSAYLLVDWGLMLFPATTCARSPIALPSLFTPCIQDSWAIPCNGVSDLIIIGGIFGALSGTGTCVSRHCLSASTLHKSRMQSLNKASLFETTQAAVRTRLNIPRPCLP